jgi:hypothetical protein
MKLNVARKIKHYKLAKAKAYYAIFEAISNSIDSYRTIAKSAQITVEFYRDKESLDLGDDVKNYQKISIVDTGIGFNDENYDSFNTSDSDYKEKYGGKGLGRFSWLKVFESVNIESFYKNDGKCFLRKFDFSRTESGISNLKEQEISDTDRETGTTVSLISQKKGWEIPRKLSTFCEKMIEYFLPLFVKNTNIQFILIDKDTNDSINANQYFIDNYRGKIGSAAFTLSNKPFSLEVHKTKIGNSNQFILFAHDRAAKNINLANHIINLNAKLEDSLGEYHLVAFLSGAYLDGIVSSERDDFDFDDDNADISLDKINEKSFSEIKTIIKDILENIQEEKKIKVEQFISNEGPEYRYLVEKKPEILENLNPTATKSEIETHLHIAEMQSKEQTRIEVERILQDDDASVDEIESAYMTISEEAKAGLTKYILARARASELLDKRISLNDDNKYNNEDLIHNLFYQMKVTSSDVPNDCNNLWLIDERLNFHDYLASDLSINSGNGDRPDVIVYNTANYFNNNDNPNNSFTIIEFKKPMRNDYAEDINPIDQVIKYIDQIRNGKAKKKNGQPIIISPNAPCFAYIICTITDKIHTLCQGRDFTKTYDGMGYFHYINNYNTYFEVLDFQKIIKDAKIRNHIFMKKLGLK